MNHSVEIAVEAGAKAFHDANREKHGSLRWETSTEHYREGIREIVRPAVAAAIAVERERCAEIAEADVVGMSSFLSKEDWTKQPALHIAAAIRAQGE